MTPLPPRPALARTAAQVGAPLPERVLQFGTGAFLRGFADAFVDEANAAGAFGGSVVVVGSTGSGRADTLNAQDGLYTLCVRGRAGGAVVDRTRLVTAVSRALASSTAWDEVLACARQPELALVVSNTTEVGLTLDPTDRPDLAPPRSFPGKLTALLHARAEHFGYDPARGLVVLPCELVEANGDVLREAVRALAEGWGLGAPFLAWLDEAVRFCNTLVDRIVPGAPDAEAAAALADRLGYRDALLTVAEPFRLWAIEGDEALAEQLPFAGLEGVVVTPDVTPYRERKVRILNGGHTSTVPAALLCGLETVAEAVGDPLVGSFVRRAILDEIVPSVDAEGAEAFARAVLDRFANPFVRHDLRGITLQQTMKWRVRVAPSVFGYARRYGAAPPSLAFGFACLLHLVHPDTPPAERPPDDAAGAWAARWRRVDAADPAALRAFVAHVCADEEVWGGRLDAVPGWTGAVAATLLALRADGPRAALAAHLKAHPTT